MLIYCLNEDKIRCVEDKSCGRVTSAVYVLPKRSKQSTTYVFQNIFRRTDAIIAVVHLHYLGMHLSFTVTAAEAS